MPARIACINRAEVGTCHLASETLQRFARKQQLTLLLRPIGIPQIDGYNVRLLRPALIRITLEVAVLSLLGIRQERRRSRECEIRSDDGAVKRVEQVQQLVVRVAVVVAVGHRVLAEDLLEPEVLQQLSHGCQGVALKLWSRHPLVLHRVIARIYL